jgi:predicted ATPase/class 3 adenylate cyclase
MPPGWRERIKLPLTSDEVADCNSHLQALLSAVGTYFPRVILTGDRAEQVGRGEFRYGTALFADVSGFTTMTERFSREIGSEGAEEITSIVHSILKVMNGIAVQYGGDLLQFAGDAALSFYQGKEHAARACRAAWEMQQAMGEQFSCMETSLGEFPLRMSIGLGSGDVFLATLGVPGSAEYAVMGPALAAMGHAEHTAQAGQIFIDHTTRELAGDDVTVIPGEEEGLFELQGAEPHLSVVVRPDLRLTPPDDSPHATLRWLLARLDALVPYLAPGLLGKLIPSPKEIRVEPEIRLVTTIFTDLRGIDELVEALGPEHESLITSVLNRHFLAVRDVVDRYDGVLHKVGAGPAGPHLLITFGAPKSHADDPERAVRAVLEMQEALVEVNREVEALIGDVPDLQRPLLRQANGITTGIVFAASVGATKRWEYTVMGDLVNLAARLMAAAADGEILVADNTVRHLGKRFDLHPREPMRVKGKSEPIPYSQVTGLAQLPSLLGAVEGRIVGRQAELDTAQGLLDEAIRGKGGVLAIHGGAGMGKTRLTQEIAQRAQGQGMEVIVGSCLSYGGDIPYLPWADVLRALLGVSAAERSVQLQQLAHGLAEADLTGWEALVAEPLDLEAEETELTASLDPRLRQQRLFDIVLELIQRHAQTQSLLLVIEDAHWTDPTSLELLDYVARNVASFSALVLILHRPEEWLDGRWQRFEHAVEIALEELSETASQELIADLLETEDVPKRLVELVVGKAQGSPFFTAEVVRAFIDAKVLREDDGRWQLVADPDQAGVPDTIHGVIQSRIDRLEETARRVLQVASVIGRIFSTLVLDGVYPYDDLDGTLPWRLSQLGTLGLVMMEVEEALESEQRYLFRHALTQDVAYESLSYARRRELHRRVGTFVETEGWEAVIERLGFLAYHFFQGRAWREALRYSLEAGRKAQREYANETAIAHLGRALQSAEELDEPYEEERLEAHEALGEVLTVAGRYDEALEHLEAARALVEAWSPSLEQERWLAELCRDTAEIFKAKGDYELALEWLERGLQFPGIALTAEGAGLRLIGAGVFYQQGDNQRARRWCSQGLRVAEQVDGRSGREVLARGNYLLGLILTRLGDLEEAVACCQRSLTIYEELGDLLGQTQAHTNLALAYLYQDIWGLAAQHFDVARTISEEVGYAEGQARIANNLGEIHLAQGQLDEAESRYRQALEITERLGMTYGVALMHNNLGAVYARAGEWDEATRHLEQSLTQFREIGSEEFFAELFRHRAEVSLGQGQLDGALAHANRSLGYAQTHDMRLEEGMTWRVLGRVYQERGELEQAEEALARALEIAREAQKRHEIALTRLELARLRLQQGREDEGRDLALQAAQVFTELGARLDMEEAERLLGG